MAGRPRTVRGAARRPSAPQRRRRLFVTRSRRSLIKRSAVWRSPTTRRSSVSRMWLPVQLGSRASPRPGSPNINGLRPWARRRAPRSARCRATATARLFVGRLGFWVLWACSFCGRSAAAGGWVSGQHGPCREWGQPSGAVSAASLRPLGSALLMPGSVASLEAAEKITQIREQASEEFENVMISSHAGEVFASN